MATKPKEAATDEPKAAAPVEPSKPVSFEETILNAPKAAAPDAEMPLSDPDFQALMRAECEFREQSGLPVDESVLSAVRSKWAAARAAKPAKA